MKDHDNDIANLIRSAGRRRRIPEDELAALEASARDAWKEMVAAERRRKGRQRTAFLIAATLLLAALGLWWWGMSQDPSPGEVELIASLEQSVGWIEADGIEILAGEGLSSGTVIETGGRAAIRMDGGQSVRLNAGTRVTLLSPTQLDLAAGALYVDSGPDVAADSVLSITTPFGLVSEIGTQYEVHLENGSAMRVRVREGGVSVTQNGESHEARAGEELRFGREGSIDRGVVAPDGPEWSWVLMAAPAFDIEGRSLGEFLDWVTRETGWDVQYADDELERSARQIVLHGTIEGLRPDESVGMILQGSGLDYTSANGTLTILRK